MTKIKDIRKGDTVMAISGNNKGLTGVVLSCENDRVKVQGLNIRKKCVKKSEIHPNGGIIDIEAPIHVSNLRICVGDEPVKLKKRRNKDGEKELYYIKDGKEKLYRSIKKPAK
jgi:large subunit ribosomal protein L24